MDVSIFIRARNEAKYISDCLESILSQDTSLEVEVILLDSESDDETVALACKFPIRVYQIPKALFHYAATLNLGVKLAQGALFVPLSAHCIPLNNQWLKELVSPLQRDQKCGASFSRQVPWPDACPIEAQALLRSFPESSMVKGPTDLARCKAEGVPLYEVLTFSNASACMRTSLLQEIPLRDLPFSEDRAFALECLHHGRSIAYCPESVVYHSHIPRYSDFRNVAIAATEAKYHIYAMAHTHGLSTSEELRIKIFPELNRAVFIFPYTLLKVLQDVITGKWRELGTKKFLRLFHFRLASIGTSIGKLQAMIRLKNSSPKVPAIADCTPLVEQMKQIKI